jgi:hypothetical protein
VEHLVCRIEYFRRPEESPLKPNIPLRIGSLIMELTAISLCTLLWRTGMITFVPNQTVHISSQYSIKHSLYSHPPFVQQKQPETFRPTHNARQPLPLYCSHDMRSSSKPTRLNKITDHRSSVYQIILVHQCAHPQLCTYHWKSGTYIPLLSAIIHK